MQRASCGATRRCGACLFSLPASIASLPDDIPAGKEYISNYKHHHGGEGHDVEFDLLAKSAERGCQICSAIKANLDRHYGAGKVDYLIWDQDGFWQGPTGESWEVYTLTDEATRSERLSIDPINEEGVHPYLGALSNPSGDTFSPKAMESLLGWTSKCLKEHSHCDSSREPVMPHRLLKVENFEDCNVRLVDTRSQRGKYAALSHRWCPQTPGSSLVKANLDMFLTQVPVPLFYPLLKDAISVCAKLGISYIWIDTMCIIQDDPMDWAIEASNMAAVYENAFITIAGSGCPDGAEGLRQTYSKDHGEQIAQINGISIYMRPQLPHPVWRNNGQPTEFSRSEEYPLMSRGWVFQERALARRTIHFTQQELVWECTEAVYCECKSSGYDRKSNATGVPLRDLSQANWTKMVAWYSTLNLTFAKDRLPALGGVARRYGESRGWTYMAGLWKQSWQRNLFWKRGNEKPKPRPHPLFAPSWSWASIVGHVVTTTSTEHGTLCDPCEFVKFIGYTAEPIAGGDDYGCLAKAELNLSGPMIKEGNIWIGDEWVKIVKDSGLDMNKAKHLIYKPGTTEYDVEAWGLSVGGLVMNFLPDFDYIESVGGPQSGSPVHLLITHNATMSRREIGQGLVLRCVDREHQVYERIGCFGTHNNFIVPAASWFIDRSTDTTLKMV